MNRNVVTGQPIAMRRDFVVDWKSAFCAVGKRGQKRGWEKCENCIAADTPRNYGAPANRARAVKASDYSSSLLLGRFFLASIHFDNARRSRGLCRCVFWIWPLSYGL